MDSIRRTLLRIGVPAANVPADHGEMKLLLERILRWNTKIIQLIPNQALNLHHKLTHDVNKVFINGIEDSKCSVKVLNEVAEEQAWSLTAGHELEGMRKSYFGLVNYLKGYGFHIKVIY